MSIEISRVTDAEEWNRLVEQSPHRTPFHRFEVLEVLAEHSNTTAYPFVGYKGQEPVGLFPVFSLSRGPVRGAFSPPPDLKIPYLGPILLNQEKVKQRKAERRHRRFNEGVRDEIESEIDPQYVHLRTAPAYDDVRPFLWNDFDETLRYTYEVDLEPPTDALFMDFSSDVRQNVRGTDEDSYEVSEEGPDGVEELVSRVRDRHAEQGVSYNVPPSFASDLHRELPDGRMRAYVCRSNGDFVGGILTLEDDGTVYRWQAVNDRSHDVPATDILDWHVIRDARERDRERYDLTGAHTPRICEYKSKFNPEVRAYYSLEQSTVATSAIKSLYKRFR